MSSMQTSPNDCVDQANRRLPVLDQPSCDRAAREVASKPAAHPHRARLTELAAAGGFLLPVSYADDRAACLRRTDPAFSGKDARPTISLKSARALAQTDEGRALLRKHGLKPDFDVPGDGPGGLATFGASRPSRMSEGRRDALLSASPDGRALLAGRGYKSSEVERLRKSIGL